MEQFSKDEFWTLCVSDESTQGGVEEKKERFLYPV